MRIFKWLIPGGVEVSRGLTFDEMCGIVSNNVESDLLSGRRRKMNTYISHIEIKDIPRWVDNLNNIQPKYFKSLCIRYKPREAYSSIFLTNNKTQPPMKKYRLKQDYRTPNFIIEKGTIFVVIEDDLRYEKGNSISPFKYITALERPDWFEEVKEESIKIESRGYFEWNHDNNKVSWRESPSGAWIIKYENFTTTVTQL